MKKPCIDRFLVAAHYKTAVFEEVGRVRRLDGEVIGTHGGPKNDILTLIPF